LTLSKKDLLLILGAISLIACGGLLTWRSVSALARSKRPPAPVTVVANWQPYVQVGERIGAKVPRVIILEFVDYACGACKSFTVDLDKVLTKHPGEVALAIRHLPILGVASELAARAAVCAGREGRFEPYHRLLMGQAVLVSDSLVVYASRAGVRDTIAFRSCMGSEVATSVVAADVSQANELGVRGTPTIFVNGEQYEGAQRLVGVIVARHVKRQRAR
jgi:protein-disulfide isomerase